MTISSVCETEQPTMQLCGLLSARMHMYTFLSGVFREEMDAEFLQALQAADFVFDEDEPELAAGFARLKAYLQDLTATSVTDLAVEYARIFLDGVSKQSAYPYESVYRSEDGLLMQEWRDEIVALYHAEGLTRSDAYHETEDHLAFELELMALYSQTAAQAHVNEDLTSTAEYVQKMKLLLQEHLMKWVPQFCADVIEVAELDFYAAIAHITRAYLQLDTRLLQEMEPSLAA